MKVKNVKRLTVISLLLTFILTGGIFAYWASEVLGSKAEGNPEITIGMGQTATTSINLNQVSKTEGNLVPAGFLANLDDVEQIIAKFDVKLEAQQGAEGAVANLVVSVLSTGHSLIVAEILPYTQAIVAGGSKVEVQIKITLTEPSTQQQYEEIKGKNFNLVFEFEAIT